jgi:hypothetical protein
MGMVYMRLLLSRGWGAPTLLVHDVKYYLHRGVVCTVRVSASQEQWLSLEAVLQGRNLHTQFNRYFLLYLFEPARATTTKPTGGE